MQGTTPLATLVSVVVLTVASVLGVLVLVVVTVGSSSTCLHNDVSLDWICVMMLSISDALNAHCADPSADVDDSVSITAASSALL